MHSTCINQAVTSQQGSAGPNFQNRAMRRCKARMLDSIIAERQAAPSGRPARLETHVWHAKRMAMATRWGCLLPEGGTGRGNASRSIIHKLREGCLIHDASYWVPFCLCARLSDLLQLLAAIRYQSPSPDSALCLVCQNFPRAFADGVDVCSDPEGARALRRDRLFLAGGKETELVLHHAGSFPRQAIGPSPVCLSPSPQPGARQSSRQANKQA